MWSMLRRVFHRRSGREKGQDLAEYAMLISLIALIVVVAVTFFGTQLSQTIGDIGAMIQTWVAG